MKKLITVAVGILAILAFTSCAEPSSVLIPVIKVEGKGAEGKVELKARYVSDGRRASRFAEVVLEDSDAADLRAVLVVYLRPLLEDTAVPVEVDVATGAASFVVSPGQHELNAWFFVWDSSGNASYSTLNEIHPVVIPIVEGDTQPVNITIGYDSQSGDIGISIMGYTHSTNLVQYPDPDVRDNPLKNVLDGGPYRLGPNGHNEYVPHAEAGNVALFMLGLTEPDKKLVRDVVNAADE